MIYTYYTLYETILVGFIIGHEELEFKTTFFHFDFFISTSSVITKAHTCNVTDPFGEKQKGEEINFTCLLF